MNDDDIIALTDALDLTDSAALLEVLDFLEDEAAEESERDREDWERHLEELAEEARTERAIEAHEDWLCYGGW